MNVRRKTSRLFTTSINIITPTKLLFIAALSLFILVIVPSTGHAAPPPSCDSDILDGATAMTDAGMQLEKEQIDSTIAPPQNVMALSCFDQYGQMFANEVGAVFSDVASGLNAFNFGGIFGDAMNNIILDVTSGITSRLDGLSSSISGALSGIFSIFGGGAGNVSYGCAMMETLWEILQCENILDFNIPSLSEIFDIGGFINSLMPSSCTGQAIFDAAIAIADDVYSDHGGPVGYAPGDIISTLQSY